MASQQPPKFPRSPELRALGLDQYAQVVSSPPGRPPPWSVRLANDSLAPTACLSPLPCCCSFAHSAPPTPLLLGLPPAVLASQRAAQASLSERSPAACSLPSSWLSCSGLNWLLTLGTVGQTNFIPEGNRRGRRRNKGERWTL